MKTSNLFVTALVVMMASSAFAQNKAYQRKKPAADATAVPAAPGAPTVKKGDAGQPADAAGVKKPESEKLDIQGLEEKYWAPKDTDFSVVQNRTYTKAKRFS